jgi:hypothetical protein
MTGRSQAPTDMSRPSDQNQQKSPGDEKNKDD